MRRPAAYLPLFLAMIALGAPHLASADVSSLAQGFSIVPDACNCGAGAGWGCVLLVIGNLLNLAIGIGVLASVAALAYAGFLWTTNPLNSENRTQGRTMLLNAVVGLVIALGAWLIVNTLLTVLTGSGVESATSKLGIGTDCLPTASDITSNLNVNSSGSTTAGFAGSPPLQNGTGACSSINVQSAASAGGMYSISSAEALTLACLAKPESSCGANTSGAKTSSGKSTSAAGPWQILLGASDKCHSLNIPACGNLQCSNAYSGGSVKPGMEALAAQCQAAANNLTCAASAAACLVEADGGYSAWTGTGDGYTHSAQQTCVSEYAGM